MEIKGTIACHSGYYNGKEWKVDENSYALPTNEELAVSNLKIKVSKSMAFGGCAPAELVVSIDVKNPRFPYHYSIHVDEPPRAADGPPVEYSVSAVMNVGWEPTGQKWIRQGDWHTDTMTLVKQFEAGGSLVRDLIMVHYPLRKTDVRG